MKNLLFLFFYILKSNYSDLKCSIHCVSNKGYNTITLIFDMMYCSLRYGSSFVDFFNFQFYKKSHNERKAYATMGVMYKFHKKVNHKDFVNKVDDKSNFFKNYSKWCYTPYLFTENDFDSFNKLIESRINNRLVIKNPGSTAGKGVQVVIVTMNENKKFINNIEKNDFFNNHFLEHPSLYIEDFIIQHEALQNISPSGVNTIRVITMLTDDSKPEIIGSVFRVSVDCPIDNYSAGNLAAEICVNTGVVKTGGIRKRSSCDMYHETHPVTKSIIKGFQIPYWDDIKQLTMEAALVVPEVRSIGWDVAITADGPILIEGNSSWNKDTWQIPAGHGKLHLINKYL